MSRLGTVLTLGALTAVPATAIDISLPAQPDIARALGEPAAAGASLVSAYFLGFGLGQIIWGPLSDRFGRLRPLYLAMCGFLAMSIVCAVAQSFAVLIGARIAQGVLGGAAPVIARAIARDKGGGPETASLLATMAIILGAAPLIAPPVGSALLALFDWRATFWFLVLFSVCLLGGMLLFLSETNPPHQRTDRSVADYLRSALPVLAKADFITGTAIASAIYLGYGAFLAVSAAVTQDHYGISLAAFGPIFSIAAAAFVVGSIIARQLTPRLGRESLILMASIVATIAGLGLMVRPGGLGLPAFWMLISAYVLAFGVLNPLVMAKALEPAGAAAGAASSVIGTVMVLAGAAGSEMAASRMFPSHYEALCFLLAASGITCVAVQTAILLVQRCAYIRRSRRRGRIG